MASCLPPYCLLSSTLLLSSLWHTAALCLQSQCHLDPLESRAARCFLCQLLGGHQEQTVSMLEVAHLPLSPTEAVSINDQFCRWRTHHAVQARGWGGNQTGLNPRRCIWAVVSRRGSLGIQPVKDGAGRKALILGRPHCRDSAVSVLSEGQGLGSVWSESQQCWGRLLWKSLDPSCGAWVPGLCGWEAPEAFSGRGLQLGCRCWLWLPPGKWAGNKESI